MEKFRLPRIGGLSLKGRTKMPFLIAGAVLLLFFILLLPFRRRKKKNVEEEEFPYRMRDDFLTEAEFAFYVTLSSYIGDDIVICPKVNLGDLFFAVGDKSRRLSFTNKINRKHVDFLLCDAESMQPLCGVELDDSSHLREDRMERDIFVDGVYEAAGLPLVHVPLQKGYTPEDLEVYFDDILHFSWEMQDEPQAGEGDVMELGEHTIPCCPRCGELMVLKVYTSGEKKGYRYYGCPNYPKCRTVVDYVTGEVGRR